MLRRLAGTRCSGTGRRRLRRLVGAAVAAAAIAAPLVAPGGSAGADGAPFVSVWVPYWATTSGATRFGGHSAQIAEVSPFFLSAVADGTVITVGAGPSIANAIVTARANGLKVIPTVTDGAGKGGMAAILADPARRAAHVANLVNLALSGAAGSGGFDGIDLDYEVFAFTDGSATWASTMPNWVQFVSDLSTALHAQGKLLTVTIPPVWNATAVGQQRDYWVYAQDRILPFVDRLRLMVYDYSPGTPSGTAPIGWVRQVVTYSNLVADATGQPRSKLELGVPAYGRHWRRSVGNQPCPDDTALTTSSVTTANALGVAATAGVTAGRDGTSGEMTFTWNVTSTGLHTFPNVVVPPIVLPPTRPSAIVAAGAGAPAVRLGPPPAIVTCTVAHTVFFPDGASIAQKAQVARSSGWGGVIIWAGGYETDDVYDALAGVA